MQNASNEILPETFVVHSVFRHAANLMADSHWISVLNSPEEGPYRIFLPISDMRKVFKVHERCLLRGAILYIGKQKFDICMPSAGVPLGEFRFVVQTIQRVCSYIGAQNKLGGDDMLWDAIRLRLDCVFSALSVAASQEQLCEAVSRTIGLGRGLSPDADDVLYGAIAAFQALGSKSAQSLANAVLGNNLDKTTQVAKHAYIFATRRLYPRRIHALFEAMEGQNWQEIQASLAAIAEFGASSGRAMLFGIQRALQEFVSD
ncbi:MAG: DUF2877 domain-containing protein [Bradymonadia bacterium]|jgi:hypothetical protein